MSKKIKKQNTVKYVKCRKVAGKTELKEVVMTALDHVYNEFNHIKESDDFSRYEKYNKISTLCEKNFEGNVRLGELLRFELEKKYLIDKSEKLLQSRKEESLFLRLNQINMFSGALNIVMNMMLGRSFDIVTLLALANSMIAMLLYCNYKKNRMDIDYEVNKNMRRADQYEGRIEEMYCTLGC